jgi:hypothetical protein
MPPITAQDKTSRGDIISSTPEKRPKAALPPPPGAEQLSIQKPEVGEKKISIVVEEEKNI